MADNQLSRRERVGQFIDSVYGPDTSTPSAIGQNQSYASDIGTSIGTGLRQLPGIATGLADIAVSPIANRPFSRGADYLGELTGFQPSKSIPARYQTLTPETQSALQAVQEAEGFGGTLQAYLENPRAIGTSVAEAVPGTLAGGLGGAAVKAAASRAIAGGSTSAVAGALSRPAVAAGVGEGAVAAGFQMEGIDEEVAPLRAAGASLATGVGTGLIAGLGGAAASKLGIGDPDMIFVNGKARLAPDAKPRRLLTRVFGGAISEGVFQEMPQGAFEQVTQNWAEERPLLEGVDKAAVESMVAGMGMGAIAGPFGPRPERAADSDTTPTDTTDKPRSRRRLEQLDIENVPDAELVNGVNALAEMLNDATPEQAQVLRDGLVRGQSEIKRRKLSPTVVDEARTATRYNKLRREVDRKEAALPQTRAQNLALADRHETEIANARAEMDRLAGVYPGIVTEYEEAAYKDAKETVEKLEKKSKGKPKRLKKNQQAQLEVAQAEVARLEAADPTLAQRVSDQQVAEEGASEQSPTSEPEVTTPDELVGEQYDFNNPVYVDFTNQLGGEPQSLFRKDGSKATNKAGEAYVDVLDSVPAIELPQLAEKLREKVDKLNAERERKGTTPKRRSLIEEQLPYVEARIRAEAPALAQQTNPETRQFRTTEPLTPEEQVDLLQFAQGRIDQKDRMSANELEVAELWTDATREQGRRDPMLSIAAELYMRRKKVPDRKNIKKWLRQAREKTVAALAVQRGISEQEAAALLPEDFLRLPAGSLTKVNLKEAMAELVSLAKTQEAEGIRGQQAEMELRRAAVRAGLVEPQFGRNPQDDTANTTQQEIAGLTQDTGSGITSRATPTESASKETKARQTGTVKLVRDTMQAGQNLTKEQARKLAQFDKMRGEIDDQYNAAVANIEGLQNQQQAAAELRERPVVALMGKFWDSLLDSKGYDDPFVAGFRWDEASQDDAVLSEFNAAFFANMDPDQWRAEGYDALPSDVQARLDATHARIVQGIQERGPHDAQMANAIELEQELRDAKEKGENSTRQLLDDVLNTSDKNLGDFVDRAVNAVVDIPLRRLQGKLGATLDQETLEGMRRMARSRKLVEDDRARKMRETQDAAQVLREQLQPKGVEAKMGSLTYADQVAANPEPATITLKEAEKAKRIDQQLAIFRRDGIYNKWIKRRGGRDAGMTTLGEDGIVYTAVKEGNVWNLYIPTAPDGFVANNDPEQREAMLFGAFENFDGEGDTVAKFVAGQTQYTEQSLYRAQARQRAAYVKQPVRSEFMVSRRRAKAEEQAARQRQRRDENAANYRAVPLSTAAPSEQVDTRYDENVARMRKGIEIAEASNAKALGYYQKLVADGDKSGKTAALLREQEAKRDRLVASREYWFAENPDLNGPNSVPRASVAWTPIQEASTVAQVKSQLEKYIPSGRKGKVKIVQSWHEIEDYLADNNIDVTDRAGGLIHNDNIFIIADNVQAGREAGVLMHEVGVHMSMSPLQIRMFADAIRNMANNGNELATAALNSVDAATDTMAGFGGEVSEFDVNHEIVAYFVEEAVTSGIDPAKLGKTRGPVRRFFENLVTYIRTTMRALGLSPQALTAQDVVDAAYGAADSVLRRPSSSADVRLSYGQAVFSTGAAQDAWENAAPIARGAWKDVKSRTRRLRNKFMFSYDFAEYVANILPGAQTYFRQVAERISRRGEFDQRIQHAVDAAKNFTSDQRTEVNEYLIDSQRKEAWGERTDWEGKVNPEKVDPELEERFAAMTPEQQDIIRNVFKLASQLQIEMRNAMRGEIEFAALDLIERENDPAKRAELEDQMLEDLNAFDQQMGPLRTAWMPLRRHGEIAVVYMSHELRAAMGTEPLSTVRALKADPEHYYVEFFQNVTEANPTQERLANEFGERGTVDTFLRQEQLTRPELIPFNMMNALRSHTENSVDFDQFGNARNTTANAQMKAWNKYYIQQLAETSIRKSELTREEVAGFDRDMLRGFIDYGTSIGGTIAAIELNRETQGTLQRLREQVKMPGMSEDDRLKRSEAFNELMYRHGLNIDQNVTPWQNKIMGTTSFWMLLTSPAYYMQNSTQPWMLTLPVLGGRFGFNQSAKALTANYPIVGRAWKAKHGLSLGSFDGELADLSVIAEEKGEDYKLLIDDLVSRGLFDIGIAADLGNFAQGTIWQRGHSKFTHAVRSVEVFNRGVTALTAMDLAKKNPNKLPKNSEGERMTPHEFAVHQTMITQGDYSGHNAPSIIRRLGGFGKIMTQFRKFQLIQIGLLTRMVHGSFNGADPYEKAMARRQLAYVLGAHGIAGGLLGLPMANLAMMAAGIFGDEDEPDDFEIRLRREIGDDAMADLILKGLPAFANVDVSAKIGMGQTFSILPFTDIKWSRDGAAIAMASLFGGPTGAQAMMWADAVGLMAEGNYALGLAQALPRGFRDAAKAVSYGTEGVRRRNPARDMAISPDEFSWFDLGMQGIGLPTERITDRQNKSRWLTQTREHFASRSARIKADYIRAQQGGDAQGMLDARQAWNKYQDARVRQGFKRQSPSLLTKAPQEQRKRVGNAVDGVFVNRSERRFMDLLGDS